MNSLLDYSFQEISDILKQYGQPSYRATQLYDAIYSYKGEDKITNIPKSLISSLSQNYNFLPLTIYKELKGSDGTIKFLYKLADGNLIEGVLMRYKYGYTLCVSTQVGCRMGCKFCASTLNGLVRNLSAGEIVAQVLCVNAYLNGSRQNRKITNVVLMGSGEPLDNFDNVLKFIKLISDEHGINISQRNISLSTCGLVDKIDLLAKQKLQITLTISLHAPNDNLRRQTMPIANRYSVKDVVNCAKRYFKETKRRIVFEYALIDGQNDSFKCADELASLLHGFSNHVNLIPLNEVKERGLKGTNKHQGYAFMERLKSKGISATMRRTMGEDIEGACGQLRAKVINITQ